MTVQVPTGMSADITTKTEVSHHELKPGRLLLTGLRSLATSPASSKPASGPA